MEDTVTQIKQKLDIVDVIGSYVSLKKSGRNYKTTCPFHSEKTPSFMVSQALQIFKCFGCGVAGDMFNFVEQIEGVDFPRALEVLADKAGVKIVKNDQFEEQNNQKKQIYHINDLTAQFYEYILLKQKAGKKALDYLKKERKLTEATIREFRLGYAPDSWDTLYKFLLLKKIKIEDMVMAGVIIKKANGSGYLDKFKGRIIFPLTGIDGKVIGFTARTIFNREPKYLNTSDTPVFHKSFFLFGLDKSRVAIKTEGAVFVEGQMDLISAYQSGIKNLICVSGTAMTDNQLVILSRYTSDVTFCFDSDFAGVEASYRAIEMAERRNFNVKVAIIPSPYKDLDELINANLNEAKKVLQNGVPVYDYFLVTTLKKYNKATALGKKNIMEDLVPLFSKISNKVLLDHYAKRISSELDVSLETIYSMLKDNTKGEREIGGEFKDDDARSSEKIHIEGYLISLLLKSSIEMSQEFIGRLAKEDFENEEIGEIYEFLSKYLKSRKTAVNIKSFLGKLDENKSKVASELYLRDLDGKEELEEKLLRRELKDLVERLKNESVKRQLKSISEEIKMAETERRTSELERLTKKFEKLSKSLL
ncbi:DNA primase [Patescibacteria group bacterium]|nr:DNA primase [Patescibacteria group bacterium]MBU1952613.1 DNA primase [Patescibacteria group bacterium]